MENFKIKKHNNKINKDSLLPFFLNMNKKSFDTFFLLEKPNISYENKFTLASNKRNEKRKIIILIHLKLHD